MQELEEEQALGKSFQAFTHETEIHFKHHHVCSLREVIDALKDEMMSQQTEMKKELET